MTSAPALSDLGNEPFVSLTTFRKSGDGVSTPVWILRDGDSLIVTTPIGSGKVKRLRNNSAVTLAPCTRMGKVKDGLPVITATAEIMDDPAIVERYGELFLAKYKFEYKLFMWIERRGKNGQEQRVMLRITR